MKQLYIIGIAVAVLVLLLMGLSKLTQAPEPSAEPESAPVEASTDMAPTEEALPEEPLSEQTPETTTMDEAPTGNTTIVMKTNMGNITIELFTKDAPITAGNFLKLVREDFYDGVKFHRVIDGFMVQGGDPLSKNDALASRWGTGGPGYSIQDEFIPGFSNVRGTLSMANSGPNTGGSQFFINTVDNVFLDNKHAVFGKVTAGMDVVDAITKVEKAPGDRPVSPVTIEDVTVL